ncbi:MAG: D-alanyl-D-alanine carboxypeptidase family protein [Emergencia sp.]|nr:D-alanyl-D-alanine carboxypeptidase family protein [Emergencia sp.]
MKKAGFIFIVIVLLCSLLTAQSVQSFAAEAKKPDITAEGAIVYCQNTGEVIYSKNRDEKIAPYSVTKLMTVLLAVQNLPLDKEVTVSAKAAAQTEASMNLKEGEVLTVRDLVYGALLPSGNDAAYALGEAVSGNMEDFVSLMNKTAEQMGCKNTHFVNPNGMDSKNHYTSAYDMMLITKMALSNDVIAKAAGTKSYTVKETNKSEERKLESHLSFIDDKDSGVYGGKTGYWDEQNCSIALGYKKNGLHLYIVLLGDTAEERTNDVNKLINYASDKVEGIHVIGKGKAEGKVRIKHGAKTRVQAYTAETGYAYLPKEASKSLISTQVMMRDDVEAPVKKGSVVGTLQIFVADDLVNEVDLIVKENVETGWFPSYLGISNFAAVIICAVLILLLSLFIWISVMRANYRRRKRKLRQEKARAIAMEQMRREQERRERDWRF